MRFKGRVENARLSIDRNTVTGRVRKSNQPLARWMTP